ncbi:unnamed protein product [Pleuronectes platessa]|uniref:Uncharacterized protein n=1 Tax=Pleuronectes platessa TaxID=8262 RepID=A0A9N7YQF3_PLEPL|nr:unnamed protein product [Pleuronectes platessa]
MQNHAFPFGLTQQGREETGRDSRPPGTGWTILRQAECSKAERLAEERQASERVNQQRMSGGAVQSRAPDLWIVCLLPDESAAHWAAVATAVEEEKEDEEERAPTALGIQILQSTLPPSLPH